MLKWLEKNLPKIVMAPAVGLIGWFVYGFVLWTLYISFTNSKILPKYELWGVGQYVKLWGSRKWLIAVDNLLIFTALFLIFCVVIGIILAIFLDQKIRAEGVLRTIYLYPMALSFIVTGTAWKWILNPTLGIQKMFIDWGFENFTFDWLVNREMAIYTIVIAGVWQSAGFVKDIYTVYWKILLPMMRPVFFTSFVILVHISIKSYDLIVALTQGGPGISTTMPALYMTQTAFHKSQVGLSAASAMMMFMAVAAVIIPYLYSELRRENAR
jgi:glucose/mannose transport system permease protein